MVTWPSWIHPLKGNWLLFEKAHSIHRQLWSLESSFAKLKFVSYIFLTEQVCRLVPQLLEDNYRISFQYFVLKFFLSFPEVIFSLLLERKGQQERKRSINVREKYQSVSPGTCPDQGPNPQSRHVPWPGSNPQPFSLWDDAPVNWATAAGASVFLLRTKLPVWSFHCSCHGMVSRSFYPLAIFLNMLQCSHILLKLWYSKLMTDSRCDLITSDNVNYWSHSHIQEHLGMFLKQKRFLL